MTKAGKLFFVIVIACACATAQQITGSIRGSISDPSGAVVQNASVTARNIETGLARITTSDNGGNFLLLELPVGRYQLEVSATGFSKYLQAGITLNVNETANVPVKLVVGSQGEKVQVEADAQLIQPTVTSLGQVVQERELVDLPLDGRDFSQLGLLQPGVAPISPALFQASGGSAGLRANQPYSVNGQRPESNNFLIDGATNFNGVDGGFVLTPPIDAIEEFRIITHSANAEFGNTLGSTTNIVTRSGSNNFHGALWEFLRNDMFDATQYPATSKQYLKRNQFGGSIGGPIQHEKIFFFGFYEGYRNHQGDTKISTVPSNAERGGDFSQLCQNGFFSSGPMAGFCKDTDPNTGQPINTLFNVFLNQPYPYNQMPAPNPSDPSSMNPFSVNLLSLFPSPNLGTNEFISAQPLRDKSDDFGLRVDHYLTSADNLNFRYMFSQGSHFLPFPGSGASVPGFPTTIDQRAQNFVAQEAHTFSSAMIGVVRFSYLRNKFLFGQSTNRTTPLSLGFQYSPSLAAAVGPPFVQVNGYTTVGNPITGPRDSYENAFDTSASLSWVRGSHELKFGGGYQRLGVNVLQGIATNGFFVFVPFPVTDSFASFLWGQPVFFLQGRGDFSREIRGWSLNGYGQDTYKLNRRVTLNYGLRYELPTPYTEIHNRQTLWIPGRQSTVMPSAPAGLLYPGDKGVPAGLIPTDKKAFAPRLGIAIDPTGSQKWLVTSSYAMFYEPYYTGQGGPLQSPISAPPYLQTPQVSLPNFTDPFNGSPPIRGQFSTPLTNLTLSPNLKLPYSQDWDLNVQRSLGQDLILEIGYVGTKGTRLPRFIEANPAIYIPGTSGGQPISTSGNADQRRLYSGCTLADPPSKCVYSSTGLVASIANSSYNALETSLRKRFSHGLSFLASYTFSKSIDDASSFNMTGSAASSPGENDLAQNPFDLAAERGRSLFDARHRFVLSYQWSLPFFKDAHGWQHLALGGWQLNGIATLMSGTPFTVYDSNDVSVQGGAPEITGFSANRPALVPGQNPNAGPHNRNNWLNANAFQRITQDPNSPVQQFGTAGRNIAEGPGYSNWDFSAFKNFRVAEGKEFQFRGELFNFLNHTNYMLPQSDISNQSTFNHILSAREPRLVQFALKFLY